MAVRKLEELLDKNKIKYITINHSPAYTAREVASSTIVPRREFAKAVMVKLKDGVAIAVLPASAVICAFSITRMIFCPPTAASCVVPSVGFPRFRTVWSITF